MMAPTKIIITCISALFLASCADTLGPLPAANTDSDSAKPDEAASSAGGKEDVWDWVNDPERFDLELVYDLLALPRDGRAEEVSWPSSYWPTYRNSINDRWNGRNELSPAEKYDLAFNSWTMSEGFMDLRPFDPSACSAEFDASYYDNLGPLANHISRNMGNWRSHDGVDSDGDNEIDECDSDSNDGVETWFGLCHAWVPAAMLEARPERSVTYNGVTFHVADLEALLIAAYNRSPAQMIGGRCRDGADDDNQVERDDQGRPIANQCRDTNAGSFHVIMTNYLGRAHRPYAEDRTYDYQVWNQPVVGFEVTRLQLITAQRAIELVGLTGDTYTHTPNAAQFYEVHANTTYITESHPSMTPADPSRYERTDYYTYVLELDASGNIIGGEWTGSSRTNHPDFLWNPQSPSQSSVPYLSLENIRMLVQMSREPETPTVDGDVITANGTGPVAIPDNDEAGVSATANFGSSATIAGLQLELNIRHTYISDLRVTLQHGGVDRVIHNREGGSDDNIDQTFNVQGFNGQDAAGTWTLLVSDHAGQDVGQLVSWRLLVTPESEGGGDNGGGDDGGGNTDTIHVDGRGNVSIPDNNASGATSTLTVEQPATIGALSVNVNIEHTWIGDLRVTLSHNGTTRILHANSGGGQDNIVQTYEVPEFDGQDANGVWTLLVVDRANIDTGRIVSWSLDISTGTGGDPGDGGTTTEPETFPGTGNVPIPDNNATGITSDAGVPTGTRGTVAINVNITHTYRGDLRVTVSHNGQDWVLHNRTGSGANNLLNSFPLSPAPQGELGGTWTLHVSDHANIDVGTLVSWSVVVTP